MILIQSKPLSFSHEDNSSEGKFIKLIVSDLLNFKKLSLS